MKNISSNYKENVKLFGRQIDSKITYELDGDEIELGVEELNSVTPHYESTILKSVMKQLDVDSNVEIPVGTVLNYQFGVKTGNTYEYIDYGNYVVYKAEKKEDTKSWNLTCYDKMLYSMMSYEGLNVTYPITVKNLLVAICQKMGVEFANANDTFVNCDKEIASELYLDSDGNSLDYTYRDILDELAQVTASVICINDEDKLEVRYVNNTGETETVEGTDLSLENVDDSINFDLELKGDTNQDGTPTPSSPIEVQTITGSQYIKVCRKNLFDVSKAQIGRAWNNGSNTARAIILTKVEPSTTYSISYIDKSGVDGVYYFGRQNESDSTPTMPNNDINTNPKTITTTATTNYLGIQVNKTDVSLEDIEAIQFQIEKESTSSDYEEYKGKDYEINLGKNLFYLPDLSVSYGVTYSINDDGTINLSGNASNNATFMIYKDLKDVNIHNGETYTASVNQTLPSGVEIRIEAYNGGAWVRSILGSVLKSTVSKYTGTVNISGANRIRYLIYVTNGTHVNISNLGIQLEKGASATDFTKQKEPIELCKIGDYQDRIYKDSGKWYIEKQIGKLILDGTQNITLAGSGVRRFNANYTTLGLTNIKEGTSAEDTTLNYRMCDHFKYSAGQTVWGGYYLYNNWLVFLDSGSVIADANALKTWFQSNNTNIYYVLATPTTTEITDTELLSQLNSVELLEGLNNISVISSNLSSPLSLTYVSELDMIDEEYLKDVNVNFGEKFGPVNAVVLSRSAESDNIYQRDEESVETNGICEVKIKDNQILNGNNRDEFLPEIFNKLNGLEYYLTDFTSTGITFYDLLDRYKVKVEDNYYKTIMFNDEADITQGLEEQVYANELEETETDYTKSDKTDRRINQAYIIVDKQNQQINSVVQSINTLQNTVNTQGEQVEALGTRITQTIDNITASVSSIQDTLDNGVNLVKTTSVTIDDEGLSVSTDTSKIKTTMTNNEFKIVDNSNTTLAKFGYDEEEQISVAVMDNLTVENYFVAGYHRTEKMEVDGEHRTGVFYIGG